VLTRIFKNLGMFLMNITQIKSRKKKSAGTL
jgi:hypothetical protein